MTSQSDTAAHNRASTVARSLPAAASSKVTPSSTEAVLAANTIKVTFEGTSRRAFTQRSFYTEERLHTQAFTQKSAYTQKSFYTEK